MAKLWEFFENLNAHVYVADVSTCELVYMNRYMRNAYGVEMEDYAGKKCHEVLYRLTEPCNMCNRHCLELGKFEEWQDYDGKLGRYFFVKDSMIEEDGRMLRIELAEEFDPQSKEERQAQEYLDTVNDIIRSGLWYMNFNRDGEMTQVVWSQKFREMLGFTDKTDFPDVLESWSDRLHPEDKAKTMAAYWGCVAGEGEYNVQYRLKKKDGEYDWFHAHGHIQTYEDGTPRLFLGTFINITKDIQTKQALDEAYQAANQANAAKTRFMANMSHDIRTPLNAIIGMTALAAAHINETKRVEHCLEEIASSSKHLLSLVNEVLDMNRIESGQLSLNIASVRLPELMDEFLGMAKPLAGSKNQELTVLVENIRHENVYGDGERIKQCMMNFLSNAVKYTPEGGKITVTVSEKVTNRPKRCCFELIFEDNGIGMSPEFMDRVFEPFARAEDERVYSQQGTGLGMAISHSIIQMMNGSIHVESELDQGTKFTATIFLEIQDEEDIHLEEHLAGLPVLVVDDDRSCCESVCHILNELGMKGEWVLTGEEAVELVAKRHQQQDDFYAVLVDWKMPGMDGIATTKAIRGALGEDVPVIIVSAYDWGDIETAARASGVNAFINKPVFKSRMTYLFKNLNAQKQEEGSRVTLDQYRDADFKGKRGLLVEDNEINAEIAVEILSMTGMEVNHAWNGKDALEVLQSKEDGAYDIVFMDIQMPVMDGYEAARAIRASDREYIKNIPIIALSANAMAEDVQRSREAGMDMHIAKPLDLERLLAAMVTLLGGVTGIRRLIDEQFFFFRNTLDRSC